VIVRFCIGVIVNSPFVVLIVLIWSLPNINAACALDPILPTDKEGPDLSAKPDTAKERRAPICPGCKLPCLVYLLSP